MLKSKAQRSTKAAEGKKKKVLLNYVIEYIEDML